ncbi:MAG: nucleotidyltransferase domain-containing protein [Bacillota bacterium]|nr:nucleotidyltransferase domain-containing protein [Bacillota bacterium]
MPVERLMSRANAISTSLAVDPGVRAVFVGGSLAAGSADIHSDIDIYAIAAEAGLDRVCAASGRALAEAGELLMLRRVDYGFPMDVFVYADGIHGELGLGTSTTLADLHYGPYRVLFDHDGILSGYTFPGWPVAASEKQQRVRDILEWYWRGGLLVRGYLARGDLLAAAEQLATLRGLVAAMARSKYSDQQASTSLYRIGRETASTDLEVIKRTFFELRAEDMKQACTVLDAYALDFARTELKGGPPREAVQRLAALCTTGV